jgi:hypothetical protein
MFTLSSIILCRDTFFAQDFVLDSCRILASFPLISFSELLIFEYILNKEWKAKMLQFEAKCISLTLGRQLTMKVL